MSLKGYKTNLEGVPRDPGGHNTQINFHLSSQEAHAHEQTTQWRTGKDLIGLFNWPCQGTTETDNKQPLEFTSHISLDFPFEKSLNFPLVRLIFVVHIAARNLLTQDAQAHEQVSC